MKFWFKHLGAIASPRKCRIWLITSLALSNLLALPTLPVSADVSGKDGSLTVSAADTVVNKYGVLAANASAGQTSITVSNPGTAYGLDPATLQPGDVLLIIQMQGATIDETDTANYGSITSNNNAGNYEFVSVGSVSGSTINLASYCTGGLKNSYTASGNVQVIRVPQYSSLTVATGASITAPAWDGKTGGIVAARAQTANINGSIDVTGKGFRGGVAAKVGVSLGQIGYRSTVNTVGAQKGESIAGVATTLASGQYGRGAPANGGGGGDNHNAAGGGGANGNNGSSYDGRGVMDTSNTNYTKAWSLEPGGLGVANSSGGGRGGYTYSSTDQDATKTAPGNTAWGGDNRRNVGGLGGHPLTSNSSNRLFFGGGGGAGDSNDATAGGSSGGSGGGLAYLIGDSVSGSGKILASGSNGTDIGNSSTNSGGNDAPGGAGGGGTVVVKATTSLTGISIEAKGGRGGNQYLNTNEAEGAGGGGGGGYIATSSAVTTSAVGGANGVSKSPAVAEFPPNGGTSGATGQAITGAISNSFCSAKADISGKVYEDVNYGGGAGRSFAASSGVVRPNARVELYDFSGNFLAATTTDNTGTYTFTGYAAGSYTVRVVNSTVTSSRTGYVNTLIPVQTFRTDASSGTAQPVTNRVGGENLTLVDAGANTTSAKLSTLTTTTNTAQSITPIGITINNISSVDFGFNFDTIVNTKDSGQGSLRQFITNSNTLLNTNLAQVGQTAGKEVSIFMIPTIQLTGNVAVITPATALPAITDANTTIDGTTQTKNVGDTNSGMQGTGGTVGVDNLTLSTVNRPEVQIIGSNSLAVGLDAQANNTTIRGISIYGFGNTANNDSYANIRIGNNFTSTLIEQNIIGTSATNFSDPGTGRSGGDNIRSVGGDNGTVSNNLIGFSAGKGFGVESSSNGWLIENNEIRSNGIGNSNLDGIDLESGSSSNTVRGNLVIENEGVGVDGYQGGGSNMIVNNTITNNGIGAGTNIESAGVRLYSSNNTVDRNIINANFGAGVMVTSSSVKNTITKNSIFANGTIKNKAGAASSNQIGIDLLNAIDSLTTGTSPYVTKNDLNDADSGGNDLLNFPILESATVSNGNLILTGFARPGSAIELFIADPDASGFGEGKTYLTTLTEGSAADTDGTTGIYVGLLNNVDQGTDNTNRFRFTILLSTLPAGVSASTKLTATATISNSTSEFSGLVTAVGLANLVLVKRITAVDSTTYTTVRHDSSDQNDNNGNWPSGFVVGEYIAPDKVKPGSTVEYTIYFLSTGGSNAQNASVCDLVPANTTFALDSLATGKGIRQALGTTITDLTNAADTDSGQFYSATATLPPSCRIGQTITNGNGTFTPTNVGGAVVVNLGTVPTKTNDATKYYGYVRFKVTVK